MSEEQSSLLPNPQQGFDAYRLAQTAANLLSLIRFDTNSYSVHTKYAYRQTTIVATVDEVRLSFEDSQFVLSATQNPTHICTRGLSLSS